MKEADSPPNVAHIDPRNQSSGATRLSMLAVSCACAAALFAYAYAQSGPASGSGSLPPQAIFVDPGSFAVLGNNSLFRTDATTVAFNPTNTPPPFFQVLDSGFLNILGPNARIVEIASNATFAFAHEAPIWVPDTNRVYFASNDGGPLGDSGLDKNNVVSFISLDDAEKAIEAGGNSTINVPVTQLSLPDTIQMTNGGTGPHQGSLLLINSGRGLLPPSLALVNPNPPHNATVLLDNFFGRQFNSLNDIKVHPQSRNFFFTDVPYGALLQFRPEPHLPNQVYRFDVKTGAVRVVADGFDKCNGIAFTADGKTAYISDTGISNGLLGINQTEPSTIYAFDVDPRTEAFLNRRVFAYIDTGVPDGIQVDIKGNVYSGTGDGVQVWNSVGTLLGKFFLNTTSANMVFAEDGNLVILAETKIFLAKIAARGQNLVT